MATRKETVEFILGKLRDVKRFSARAMFGEYALYADGEVVALICDGRLYVRFSRRAANWRPNASKATRIPGPNRITSLMRDNFQPCRIFQPSCWPLRNLVRRKRRRLPARSAGEPAMPLC